MAKPALYRPTREERRELGRAARTKTTRVGHAAWDAAARTYSPVDLILASEQGRVEKLVTIKHERMLLSPFAFYRGSVPLMAADLASLPRTDLLTQLCGDAHVHNLGSYAAPDGRIIFDINDFDESIPGPFEWDMKRMAASLVLAGHVAGDSDRQCKDAVLAFAAVYRESMRFFSEMPVLDLARYQVTRFVKRSPVGAVLAKAARATNQNSFGKLAVVRNGRASLRVRKPTQYGVSNTVAAKVKEALHDYSLTLLPERRHFFSQYQVASVGFRVVGCGSVGMRDYVALMIGGGIDDPLFMQVKEETHSAYARYLPAARVAENQGQRVAEGQRALQLQSDIFLGWTQIDGRDYLVRQLRDHKASIQDDALKGPGLVQYARVCGELLAKGHARSGDPCVIYGYIGNSQKFDKAIAKFAAAYAVQTVQDFEEFTRAMRTRTKLYRAAAAKRQVKHTAQQSASATAEAMAKGA
jgi:uncharacterized protein (DUF2252 family)